MRRWTLLLATTALLLSCSKQEDVIVYTPTEKQVEPRVIDRDPLALLPSGIVALVSADMQALFASQFGDELLVLADRFGPLPKVSGFEPKRDLHKVVIASYSMQGVDTLGVMRGAFDPEAVARAVESGEPTPLGPAPQMGEYAGHTVYAVHDTSFAVLSKQTVLFGNATGLQRALDRVEEGRAERQLPQWLDELLATRDAPIVAALDFAGEPAPDALRRQLVFLDGLQTARVVGNLKPPGINLAGTLTYGDEAAAKRGAEALNSTEELLKKYAWLLAAMGIGQPIDRIQAEPRGKEAIAVVGVNGQAVRQLLARVPNLIALPQLAAQPVDATAPSGTSEAP